MTPPAPRSIPNPLRQAGWVGEKEPAEPLQLHERLPGYAPTPLRSQSQEAAPSVRAAPEPVVAKAAEPVDPQEIIANLREGDWIDLYSKRRWRRAQLIWASTRGTLFMFVSHGGEPHSMTKRICERLIRERFLRPVRMHGVVAQALKTLDREDAVNPAS